MIISEAYRISVVHSPMRWAHYPVSIYVLCCGLLPPVYLWFGTVMLLNLIVDYVMGSVITGTLFFVHVNIAYSYMWMSSLRTQLD